MASSLNGLIVGDPIPENHRSLLLCLKACSIPDLLIYCSATKGRFPASPTPSDICHSADLRRAAPLRSTQMRTQPSGPSPFKLPFGSGQENVPNIEVDERPCSFMKSLVDDREYHIEECSSFGHLRS